MKDKIDIVQTLWDEIAEKQAMDSLSAEHKKILDDRLQKITNGEVQFKTWAEVQEKYETLIKHTK